ncbi:peptidylprolyl isomerase [Devosia nitrariae]|uniref:Peptidyl-prolyl cis-trans isomerase n=1 Tax=Devosia nitrariae TaxID=2071872 RepID=A0ABQ5WDY3_9HYPH|nr:peptidylprolyl isomerase [Devosia nitrariae]GLQ57796.1 peptidyl-prolyl cis-trans isomerase [Devosia nitrariae]
MLDGLRNFAKSGPGKILGAFLLVGVAGFGINNVILDLGSNTVARVGSEEISSVEFQRAYRNEISRFAQQFGSSPTPQEATNMGLPSRALQRLSQDAALDNLAGQLDLGVSDERLGQMLREDPSFAGTLGTFDPQAFTQVLQRSGMTEAQYFADQSKAAGREQLVSALFADTPLPQTAASLLARYIGDTRTIDYFVVAETSILPPDEPTDADLAAYLGEHQAEFRTVETRNVDILSFSPQTLAETIDVSQEEVTVEYEERRDSLATPERRTIEQVVLANDEQVGAFEAGLAAGESFETLVAEAGLTPTALGTLARGEITDASLAQAAFGLEEGAFAIIPGAAGRRAIHVSAIEPSHVPSLEEARDQIAQELALAAARNQYAEILDQIEELRAAFQPLTDIAVRYGLEVTQLPVTASGAALAEIEDIPQAERARVAQAIFAAEPERLTPGIALGGNHNIWFDLKSVEPARDQTLEEVREEVAAAWTREQTEAAIAAQVAEITDRLNMGESLADLAAAYNQFPQISSPFTRSGEAGTAIDSTVANAVFAGGPEHHGSAVNAEGEHVVFEVVDVAPDTDGLDEQTLEALDNESRLDLVGGFVTGVREDADMRINQQALEQAMALATGQ